MQTVKFTLVANCENVMEAHKTVSKVLSFSKRTKMSIEDIEQNFREELKKDGQLQNDLQSSANVNFTVNPIASEA